MLPPLDATTLTQAALGALVGASFILLPFAWRDRRRLWWRWQNRGNPAATHPPNDESTYIPGIIEDEERSGLIRSALGAAAAFSILTVAYLQEHPWMMAIPALPLAVIALFRALTADGSGVIEASEAGATGQRQTISWFKRFLNVGDEAVALLAISLAVLSSNDFEQATKAWEREIGWLETILWTVTIPFILYRLWHESEHDEEPGKWAGIKGFDEMDDPIGLMLVGFIVILAFGFLSVVL